MQNYYEAQKMKTADQGVTVLLIPLVGDEKTMTSREFPAYWGTKIECIWGESPPNTPLRPEAGGAVVSNDWCITW